MSNRISVGIHHPNIRNIAKFSIRLLQNTIAPNVNTLISPTSLLAVLNMAQFGARGMTKMEMETIFGGNAEQLSELLSIMYSPNVGIDELIWNYKTVRYANAVWVCDNGRLQFNENYLTACKEKSHAEIIRGDFDQLKVAKINDWAAKKTDGAIPYIVDEVPSYQIMLLLSALAFNGQWDKIYKSSDIKQHPFIAETGEAKIVEFMQGEENRYLIADEARGFIKPYKDGRYAFAALVPNKGIAIGDFVAHLTGERLLTILERAIKHKVDTLLPKFEIEQRLDLREPLMQMGLTDAFDQMRADFTGIGVTTVSKERLYIGNVWQNNKIQINEEGTKAYSITGLDTLCYSCIEQKPYKVYLDRPFLYMIIDQKTYLPLFMGTVTNL